MDTSGGSPTSLDLEYLCVNCGSWAKELNPVTGFCFGCSPVYEVVNRVELQLAANADAVQHYMNSVTNSVWVALKLAQSDRPICVVCGERIHRAPRTSVFCRKYKECRRYSRRYVYLYRERGMTKVEALAQIFVELTGD